MLRIQDCKLKPEQLHRDLKSWTAEYLHLPLEEILSVRILRESIDARKKPDVTILRQLQVEFRQEKKFLESCKNKKKKLPYQVESVKPFVYPYPEKRETKKKVIVIGAGPAGLFCAYFLALSGIYVTLLERGKSIDQRTADVTDFWNGGKLLPNSNVSFGEGGAGTFSDGKLNTVVKDKTGRNKAVLETFVKFGAGERILYDAKPHIGTDVLSHVVKRMREEIQALGGEVRFESQVTDFEISNQQVSGLVVNGKENIDCDTVVLAMGHSARDTFEMLKKRQFSMEQKPFAVGFRVEHPQDMISVSQYGETYAKQLPAAPYKVTAQASNGRNVYSFCMCPGGYVVNASSEEGRLCVNGMSYSGRDGENANSAIIINVTPEDFGSEDVLAGMYFQRNMEEKAYQAGQGKIPCMRYGDFKAVVSGQKVERYEEQMMPATKGEYAFADITSILPMELNRAFVDGMEQFGKSIQGFNRPDAIVDGVESRTSSPVRVLRDETLQSNIGGIYPCGEGAGYAGGIVSAAMDGIRVAEQIILTV